MIMRTPFLFRACARYYTADRFRRRLAGLEHLRHRCCIIRKMFERITLCERVLLLLPIPTLSLVSSAGHFNERGRER
jgi:hypothetical protein